MEEPVKLYKKESDPWYFEPPDTILYIAENGEVMFSFSEMKRIIKRIKFIKYMNLNKEKVM